jgi:hypothetical protein
MQKQLDARLLAAFHAVDLEDMSIILGHVELLADKRTAEKRRAASSHPTRGLRLIDCRELDRAPAVPIN